MACHFVGGDTADTEGSLRDFIIPEDWACPHNEVTLFTLQTFYDGEPVRQLLQCCALPEQRLYTSVPILSVERNVDRSWCVHMCNNWQDNVKKHNLSHWRESIPSNYVKLMRNKQSVLDDSLDSVWALTPLSCRLKMCSQCEWFWAAIDPS